MNEEIILHVQELVYKAGKRILEIYETEYDVIRKDDGSPVTVADIAVHDILTRGLSKYGWPVLSEESKATDERLGAKYVWIIDPIDGTNGFINKNGEFAIQIALVEYGKPLFGVVYRPTTNQYFYAERGKGSFVIENGSEIRRVFVSEITSINDAKLAVSKNHFDDSIMVKLKQIGLKNYFHVGGIGVRIGLIVEQKADVYLTTTDKLGEWDICAPQIILEEAGGIMTGIHGEEITYNNKDPHNPHGILASPASLHTVLIDRIKHA